MCTSVRLLNSMTNYLLLFCSQGVIVSCMRQFPFLKTLGVCLKERDMWFTEEQNQQNRVTAGYFQRGKKKAMALTVKRAARLYVHVVSGLFTGLMLINRN